MPVSYYIIPTTEGPYSRQSPRKPKYVDEIKSNWVGQPLPLKDIYLCKVNTTEEKHTDLASRSGVKQIPRKALTRIISSLTSAEKTKIQQYLSGLDLPYYTGESLRHLIQRIVVSGLFNLPNVSRDTLLKDLPTAVKDRGGALLDKWNISYSGNDTVLEILQKCRDVFYNPDKQYVTEF